MKTTAIIAEYNPFHNGHKYLTETARELTGSDNMISIMSGCFVQRGAPAICSKYHRTHMALNNGCDVVFELPVLYSLGSAENFASGAVNLLCSLGTVDHICFGSECGDIDALSECASLLEELSGTENFKEELAVSIKNGASYPSSFSAAVNSHLGEKAALLSSPNNILAIEYLRALIKAEKSGKYPCIPVPLTVKRIGSGYSDTNIDGLSSATGIRKYVSENNSVSEIKKCVPESVFDIISDIYGKSFPVKEDDFSDMLFLRLNSLSNEEILNIPDINMNLLHKLLSFKGKKILISDLIMSLKSKCFTYSAISRALFRILLEPYYSAAFNDSSERIPYLRLLGFKKNASEFLRGLRNSDSIRLITKPADADMSDPGYLLDIYAANLYEQICSNKYKTGFTEDLKTGPIIL